MGHQESGSGVWKAVEAGVSGGAQGCGQKRQTGASPFLLLLLCSVSLVPPLAEPNREPDMFVEFQREGLKLRDSSLISIY